MPDIDHYRRRYPELSEEQVVALHRTLRGLACVVVEKFEEQARQRPAEGDRLPATRAK